MGPVFGGVVRVVFVGWAAGGATLAFGRAFAARDVGLEEDPLAAVLLVRDLGLEALFDVEAADLLPEAAMEKGFLLG